MRGRGGLDPEPLPKYNLSVPRSRCPNCHKMIKWYQNIPVISWLFLKGKCSSCNIKISKTYPMIELLIGLSTAFFVWKLWPSPMAVLLPVIFTMAVILLVIDMKHMLLPDSLTFSIMWIGLLSSCLHISPLPPELAILGVSLPYMFFFVINKIVEIWKGIEGMGYGDIKYMSAIGAWFGPEKLVFIVLAICVLAIALFGLAEMVSRLNLLNKESQSYKDYSKTVNETKKEIGLDEEEYKYKRIMPLGPSISIVFIFAIIIEYVL